MSQSTQIKLTREIEEKLLKADLYLIDAYLDEEELTKELPEGMIKIESRKKYLEGFEQRYGLPFEDVAYAVTEGCEKSDFSKDLMSKRLHILKMRKATSSVTEAVAMSLKMHMQQMKWPLYHFTDAISYHIKDANLMKLINLFKAQCMILYGDLCFLEFVDGELASVPEPFEIPITPSNHTKVQKDDGSEEIKKQANEYDVRFVNELWKSVENVHKLLAGFIELLAEEENIDHFKNELMSAHDLSLLFMNSFSVMLDIAHDARVFMLKAKASEQGDDIPVAEYEDFEEARKSLSLLEAEEIDDDDCLVVSEYEKANVTDVYEYEVQKIDKRKGLVYGIVLKPGTSKNRDLQGQWIEAPAIEETMRNYMREHQVLGEMHVKFHREQGVKNPDFRLIQNFIAPVTFKIGEKVFPKGSWIQEWLILNQSIRKKVFNGTYKGFSVGGVAVVKPDKNEKEKAA